MNTLAPRLNFDIPLCLALSYDTDHGSIEMSDGTLVGILIVCDGIWVGPFLSFVLVGCVGWLGIVYYYRWMGCRGGRWEMGGGR